MPRLVILKRRIVTPPVRGTNVFPPSEVKGRGIEKNDLFKIAEGKELNVYRNSDCEVKIKAGLCEGRVKAVAKGAQRVINPDNIGYGSFEMKGDKGVANPEGLIRENICEEKYPIGSLMGCEKQLTMNRESFRNHTIAKIAGHLRGGKENMCKADVRKGLEDGLAMRLPLSEPREIYKDKLETDNRSNIGSEFNFEIDLPGKRDRSSIYRLNLIKLYRRKPELANLVKENSSEGIDSETLYSEFEPGDASRDLSSVKKGKFGRKDQRGKVRHCTGFVEVVFSSFSNDELSEAHHMRYDSWHVHYYKKSRFKFLCAYDGCNLTTLILRLLEQIDVSRMVDTDILIQIWKNREKIDSVLKWLSRVGSEVGPTKAKLETWASLFRVDIM
ncbi:uncharacterized protein TNCV_1880271 [Trichonephila clavipes]|nr:uncharacterized protein TNCV_1880271 [Trichonephila clavipes]